MQTFLPYADFAKSARVLDTKRLGKQRIECKQILRALTWNRAKGWRNHPAALMWKGHELFLVAYAICICTEWRARGYRDTQLPYFRRKFNKLITKPAVRPPWFGNRAFHRSHQSNLLRKDAAHYRQFFKRVPSTLPYVWPVSTSTTR